MRLTVDRITEGIAVLEKEDMTHIEVCLEILPQGLKEGNVLRFDGSDYTIDLKSEEEARKRILSKQKRVFGRK